LEESARSLFSKLLISGNPRTDSHLQCSKFIAVVIKCNIYLGLFLLVFGIGYSSLFLRLLAGRRWVDDTDAATALAAYCVFIPVLGINGITEGFVHVVAKQQELHNMTRWMMWFFAVYAVSAVVFLQGFYWGTTGLIVANTLNMMVCIIMIFNFSF
jgi:oligosaccharide translocation protein RFT1